MNRSRSYLVVLCAALCVVTTAAAIQYRPLVAKNGVEATVSYNQLGPNNQVVAYVKFLNTNDYKVDVNWKPVITCGSSQVIKGAAARFSIEAKSSFEVTIWRSMACGSRPMQTMTVEMEVTKSGSF